MKASARLLLSLALMAPIVGASEPASLIAMPVAGRVIVPESPYRDASARAARTGSPVEIALSVGGAFEGKQQ